MLFSKPSNIFTIASTKNPTSNIKHFARQHVKEKLIRDLKPILQVAQIFGLAPYSIKNTNFTVSKSGLTYSAMCFIIYCYIYAQRILTFINRDLAVKITILYIIIMVTSALCMGIDILACVLWNKKQQECLNLIRCYDISMKYENETKNNFVNWSWMVLLGILVLILTIVGIECKMNEKPILGAISYFVFCSSLSLGILKFLGFAMIIFIRFRAFNRKLITDLSYIVEMEENHRNLYFQEAWQRHEYLIAAAKNLNSMHTVKLLIWFSTLSLTSTLQIYEVSIESSSNIYDSIRKILLILFLFIHLIAIASVCHLTAGEANRIREILFSLKNFQRYNRNEKQDICLLGQHFQFNSFHFSASGFFNINLSVLLTVASTMTTYLVILMSPSEC